MKLTRRRVILAKEESVYGTDAAPDASCGLVVRTGSDFGVSAQEKARDVLRDTLTPLGTRVSSKVVNLKMVTEFKGGGVDAGDILVPEYDALLVSCGMQRSGDATSGWTYIPVSDPGQMKSCTVYWYNDGILHKAVGCRGTFSFNLQADEPAGIEFSLTGLYVEPADQAMPSPVLADLLPPVVQGINLSLGSYAPVARSFSFSLGAELGQRKDLNASSAITGLVIRSRTPKGSLDPEVDALGSFNPWTAWSSGTTAAISAALGTNAGNRINISIPKAQYQTPKYGDREGVLVYSLPFIATGDGDDEISLEFV